MAGDEPPRVSSDEGRVRPAFLLWRRRLGCVRLAACVILATMLAVACSGRFDWRDIRSVEGGFVVALPDKPQTVAREFAFGAGRVSMTMTSTGVGPTLFAVGVVVLPPEAVTPEAVDSTVNWFRDALIRNVDGQLTEAKPLRAALGVASTRRVRAAQEVSATGRDRSGRATRLAARFYVVDDRLYQVVAIGAEAHIEPPALQTFFDSFRLLD